MTDMVRAAVQVAPGQMELREFPRPTTGADDGLLRVEANGICGSDVETFRGHRCALPPAPVLTPASWPSISGRAGPTTGRSRICIK